MSDLCRSDVRDFKHEKREPEATEKGVVDPFSAWLTGLGATCRPSGFCSNTEVMTMCTILEVRF